MKLTVVMTNSQWNRNVLAVMNFLQHAKLLQDWSSAPTMSPNVLPASEWCFFDRGIQSDDSGETLHSVELFSLDQLRKWSKIWKANRHGVLLILKMGNQIGIPSSKKLKNKQGMGAHGLNRKMSCSYFQHVTIICTRLMVALPPSRGCRVCAVRLKVEYINSMSIAVMFDQVLYVICTRLNKSDLLNLHIDADGQQRP